MNPEIWLATHAQLFSFISIVTVLTLTPAATTMLVMRNVVGHGTRAGILVALGGCIGVFVHATFSALGLSLLLVQSARAFQIVKMVGAGYLIVLGCQSIWRAMRTRPNAPADWSSPPDTMKPKSQPHLIIEGLLTALLSPEISVFYLAMLPQFIQPGSSMLMQSFRLATIHVCVRLLWYGFLAISIGQVAQYLKRWRVKQGLEFASGVALLLFGLKVATVRR